MKLAFDGTTFDGPAVDLSASDLGAEPVARAIRGEPAPVTIECEPPGQLFGHVGVVRDGMTVALRPALAATARSRGHDAPQDDAIAAVRDRLDGLDPLDPPSVDLAAARADLAAASRDVERLRERVARLQGRVQAERETGDAVDAEAALADVTRELTDVETDRAAARQRLARLRERQREAHDRRDERLRLEDRLANLERDARKHLADQVRDGFETARNGAPGPADEVATVLAVARVATLRAPVVLDCRRFPDADAAHDWLDAPVIRL